MSLTLAYAVIGVGEVSVIAAVSAGVSRGRVREPDDSTGQDEKGKAEGVRKLVYLQLSAFVVLGLVGGWVGLLVTSGSPDSDRVAAALVGWAAGKVACWLAMLAVLVVRAWRDTLRRLR